MILAIILSIGAFAGMFVLFLVVANSLNSIINQLTKLEYLLTKEYDFKKEALEIKRLLEKQNEEERRKAEEAEREDKK